MLQGEAIEFLELIDTQRRRVALEDTLPDRVARFDDIVDLLPEIFLRRRKMELPVDPLHDLLFCERVPFDRSCGKNPLGQEHPVELFCHGGKKGNASKVLTLGLCITQKEPEPIVSLPQVKREGDPRM